MTRRCDRCGAVVRDVVGSRQASLFDTVDVDPRATDEARAELRAGRVLCPACARTGELFPTAPRMDFDVDVADVDGSVDRGMRACVDDMRTRSAEHWERTHGVKVSAVRITAPRDPFPRPVVDHWTGRR